MVIFDGRCCVLPKLANFCWSGKVVWCQESCDNQSSDSEIEIRRTTV